MLRQKKFLFKFTFLICQMALVTLSANIRPEKLADYPNAYFIETGTYEGDTVEAALQYDYEKIFSIELSEELFDYCQEKFEGEERVSLYCGDSVATLPQILGSLDKEATIWLDAHYSGGKTAQGDCMTPILSELQVLAQQEILTHTILIDDMFFVGSPEFDFITLEEIMAGVKEINPDYEISFIDGCGGERIFPNGILVAQVPKGEK